MDANLSRRVWNLLAKLALWLSAAATCALLLVVIGYIFLRGAPGLSWELLTTQESILRGTMGILPSILNTLYVVLEEGSTTVRMVRHFPAPRPRAPSR